MSTLSALLSSRKFWVALITISAIALSGVLVALGKMPLDQLTTFVAGLTTIGVTLIGGITLEDVASYRAGTHPNASARASSPPDRPAPMGGDSEMAKAAKVVGTMVAMVIAAAFGFAACGCSPAARHAIVDASFTVAETGCLLFELDKGNEVEPSILKACDIVEDERTRRLVHDLVSAHKIAVAKRAAAKKDGGS